MAGNDSKKSSQLLMHPFGTLHGAGKEGSECCGRLQTCLSRFPRSPHQLTGHTGWHIVSEMAGCQASQQCS